MGEKTGFWQYSKYLSYFDKLLLTFLSPDDIVGTKGDLSDVLRKGK